MPEPNAILKGFLTSNHPIYDAMEKRWQRNEAAYRGGDDARTYLKKFEWESRSTDAGQEHYDQRKDTASFIPFPARMVERFVGYLSKDAPTPGEGYDFGSLGEVREMSQLRDPWSRAEMVYYDCDNSGSSFPAFMNSVQQWSIVTGHRWVGVESPRIVEGEKTTLADEQDGLKPYLVDYSPLSVPNWHFENNDLAALRIRLQERILSDSGEPDGNYNEGYTVFNLLYVAEGLDDFGPEFEGGGWWMFDEKGNPYPDESTQATGDLSRHDGEIPFLPLFFASDSKTFSRPGLSDIAASALAYMNLSSAGDNDAIEGGSRTMYVLGTDEKAFKILSDTKLKGARLIPVPPAMIGGVPTIPQMWDSGQVDASSAIESAIERKKVEVSIASSDELVRSPDASGEARRIEFQDVKAPRLSLMAGYRESAETTLLRWLQERFGLPADASAVWPDAYDVDDAVIDWTHIADLTLKMGADSPTLARFMVSSLLKERGLIPDEAIVKKIEAEILESAELKKQAVADLAEDGRDGESEEEPALQTGT